LPLSPQPVNTAEAARGKRVVVFDQGVDEEELRAMRRWRESARRRLVA
jgi:hypothetical protein